jgi:hypothetical protein
MRFHQRIVSILIFLFGFLVAGSVFAISFFDTQEKMTSIPSAGVQWIESAGEGRIAPACASSDPNVSLFCSKTDGLPFVRFNWNDVEIGGNDVRIYICDDPNTCTTLTQWAGGLPDVGTYEKHGLPFNTRYSYGI